MLVALSVLHRACGGIQDITPNTICLFQLSDSLFWWYLFICSKMVVRVCTWGTRQLPGVSQSYRQFEPPLVCSMLPKLCSGVACVGEEVEKCWSRARQKQIAGWWREANLFIAPRLKTAVHGYLPVLENFQCSHNEENWVCKVYVYSKDLYTTRLRCLLTAGEIVPALMEHSFTEQEITLSKGRPSLGRLKSPLF